MCYIWQQPTPTTNYTIVLKNYLIVAWRNIIRRPFYSALNLAGICTAILFLLLVAAFSGSEWKVNRQLRHADRLYFLISEWKNPDEGVPITTLGPLAKRLKEDYPGLIANYYRGDFVTSVVSNGDRHFREHIDIGDSSLLTMFGFTLVAGDAATAMKLPFSVVIKKEIAQKYFGRINVVGERLQVQNFAGGSHEFVITGVLEDIPENSVTDLNFENHHSLFIPANTFGYFPRPDREDWTTTTFPSFIELRKGVTAKDLAGPIKQLIQKYAPADLGKDLTVRPRALIDYHLQKDNRLIQRTLYALCFVSLFILLMATVNFINISISSSAGRIKEIGIRKVLGGLRREIIFQFLAESMLLVLFAVTLAIFLYPLAKPGFEALVGKVIPDLADLPASGMLLLTGLVVMLGTAAGIFPAIALSSMQAAESIKGRLRTVGGYIWLRKSLAGFQFCLAEVVIIAAIVVTSQIGYFFGGDLGYTKEYVVTAQVPRDWTVEGVRKMEVVRDQFATLPEVKKVSLSYEIPDGMNQGRGPIYRADRDSASAINVQEINTDENYMDVYQVPMRAGTFLQAATALDPKKVVVNESAVRALGWSRVEDALGAGVRFPGFDSVCTIVGITADFHFNSMKERIPPIVYGHVRMFPSFRYLSFRLSPGNTAGSIRAIEKKWAALLPGSSCEYRFMDDTLKNLYKPELQLQKAVYVAAFLSLLIVLMGVTAFVSMSIRKRTKEIGIRKVLGASAGTISGLFVRDFGWVLLVSGLVACPVAWVVMHYWLNNYAYRVPLTAGAFVFSVLGLGGVTVFLVVLQTLKASFQNPVDSLKVE